MSHLRIYTCLPAKSITAISATQARPWRGRRGWWRGPGATLRWRAGACPPPPTSTWWSGSAAAAPAPSAPPTQTPASASSDTTTRSLRSAARQKYLAFRKNICYQLTCCGSVGRLAPAHPGQAEVRAGVQPRVGGGQRHLLLLPQQPPGLQVSCDWSRAQHSPLIGGQPGPADRAGRARAAPAPAHDLQHRQQVSGKIFENLG